MTILPILAAADSVLPQIPTGNGVAAMLCGAVSALATAVVFLYTRQGRSEARTQKALEDQAALCESEKVRMMQFTLKLIDYITELTKINCPYAQCPVRNALPPVPQATPEDLGMRAQK